MLGQTPLALLTMVLGALETAGAVQELVFRGILQSRTGPLCIGAIGTVAGAVVLATGIALLLRSPRVGVLIPATAWPTFIISGIVYRYAGWPITAAGIAFPLLLVLLYHKSRKSSHQPA